MTTDYNQVDIAIIGGGPAGLAAAVSAVKASVRKVLILERDKELGGILNQCIHNGFGLHTFKEELTGPEYAARYISMADNLQIPYELETMVLSVARGEEDKKIITLMNPRKGLYHIEAKAVILAMGCRERPRGALNIPGYRPAGIYCAGTAQRYVNMEGRMPGREAVILGSGDIGLIMARRMTLEGARVKVVAELMPYSGGLKRNIVQCLDDFDIPLKLEHTVVDIDGRDRVKGVTLAQVDENKNPIPGTEEYISCDTLLLSCGLIPENELTAELGAAMNPVTGGPLVNESLETNIPSVFACGNVLHVHDLVDYVTEEAGKAGACAAAYVLEKSNTVTEAGAEAGDCDKEILIQAKDGIRYTVPAMIRPAYMEEMQLIRFRVDRVYQNISICVYFNDTCVTKIKKRVLAPAEMEQIRLKKEDILKAAPLTHITICIRQE